jgi:hypothetical protein
MTMPILRPRSTAFFAARTRRLPVLPEPDLGPFRAADVRFAATSWTLRAEQEHRSAAVFSALAHALVASGVPLDLADAALAIASDELGHASLCADLVRRFEVDAPSASTAAAVPQLEEDRDARRLALRLWLVEGAIGETISSALFARGRNLSVEPCTRAALASILRDEVRHARTSWEALGVLLEEATAEEREWLEEQARLALGAIETTQMVPVFQRLERGEPFNPQWSALGVLPPEARVEVFYDALERRVAKHLGRLGIDFARAWARRHRH